ncbi:MAG: hypothetical protein ACXU8A_01790 [Burkholderiaceae bacterium]
MDNDTERLNAHAVVLLPLLSVLVYSWRFVKNRQNIITNNSVKDKHRYWLCN